jgi:hypothetical protein
MATGIGIGNSPVFETVLGATAPTGCPTDYSLELDGLTEYGYLNPGSPILGTAGTGNWSVTFWIKTPDATGGGANQRIFTRVGGNSTWSIYLKPSGKIQFNSSTTNPGETSWNDEFSSYTILDNTWTFISYTVDRSGFATFKAQGVNPNSKNVSAFNITFDSGGQLYMGRNFAGQFWEGNLCHLAFWNKKLLDGEQLQLYNNTTNLCYGSDFTFSGNLQNYWSCFNPDGIYADPLPDTAGSLSIPLINTDATNVSTDHPL